ncbi:MAG: glycosyltransferase, partial [Bacteroidia bacterium]|nr:glycosyltransferase [Bacteroidia bacterium]
MEDKRVKGIKLSRNFGQQIAMSAGMRYALGEYTIIMDCDLQNPPEVIPEIIARLQANVDIVYTVSDVRNNFTDEYSSKLFWFLMNEVLNVNIIPNQLMMKGFSRRFLNIYNTYDERVRVVAGITHDIGMHYEVLQIKNKKRLQGKGNYSFLKRFHLMLDIILAMTNKPLEYLINVSILALFLIMCVGLWNLINYLLNPNIPPGYTTLLIVTAFFGSLTLLVLGIIGRYLANIYVEIRQRPLFIVNKVLNLNQNE